MRLLLRNLLRKPLRTFLTVLGVAVALFLFCFLETVLEAFNAGANMADASRVVVQHKEAITFTLPVSYQAQIAQVEGVRRASTMTWFGGLYPEPSSSEHEPKEQFFGQFAIDFDSFLDIYPEVFVSAEDLRDVKADRSGCILGDQIAERLHKKIGDRIRLRSTIWPQAGTPFWEFTVRGIYTTRSSNFDRTNMFFHWKYLDEGREFSKGTTGIFIVSINDPAQYPRIAAAIDTRFENSPFETRSMTEKAFNMQFISMMGNLSMLLRSVGSAVVLTMLLISANTMMMSGRERTREMGILKAIGFTDGYVFRLLIGEALVISALGALMGAGGTWLLINVLHFNPKPDFFPIFILPTSAMLAALLLAVIAGFLSGLPPAIHGMRLQAAEAVRSV